MCKICPFADIIKMVLRETEFDAVGWIPNHRTGPIVELFCVQ